MFTKALTLLAVSAVAVLAAAPLAEATTTARAAAPSIAVVLDVTSAQSTNVGGDSCTWTIGADATLINITSQQVTVTAVAGNVSWKGPNNTSGVVSALVPDSLFVGKVLPPTGQYHTGGFTVTTDAIPCSATWADLALVVSDSNGGKGSGDHIFLEPGTGVPVAGVGAAAAAGFLAVLFAGFEWRRRRRKAAGLATPTAF